MNKSYLIAFTDDNQPYIAHYGVQGMKKGVRRYQNPDGSLTPEGMEHYGIKGTRGEKKYLDKNGILNAKGLKRQAKVDYKDHRRDINRRRAILENEYAKKKSDALFGFDSGSAADRAKKHLTNEYEKSKKANKLDQEELDAKRAYRQKIGKKKTDTFLMKMAQENINTIKDLSQSEFNKLYVTGIVSNVRDQAVSQIEDYEWDKRH